MDSPSYQHLLQRIEQLHSAAEADDLERHIRDTFGATQRRGMLLSALDAQRLTLEGGTTDLAMT